MQMKIWTAALVIVAPLTAERSAAQQLCPTESECTEERNLSVLGASGSPSNNVEAGFSVLGVAHYQTTLMRRSGRPIAQADVQLTAPPGTQVVVPVLSGWQIGYGTVVPEEGPDRPGEDDRYLGSGRIQLFSRGLTEVNNTVRFTLVVQARLSDANGDDAWWARAHYHLLYLGFPTGNAG